MKRFFAVFFVCLALVATSVDADAARRFGGGSSFGRSAPTFSQKAPAAAPKAPQQQQNAGTQQNQRQTATPAQQAQRPSMMRSVLTGLAAALGISALLSLLGINGAGLVSMITGILLAIVIFFAIRMALGMFMKKQVRTAGGAHREATPSMDEPVMKPMPRESSPMNSEMRSDSVMAQFATSQQSGVTDITPSDFDREGFLKTAREQYVKLQKAWDTGNVIDISDFTTQDVFIALTHQLRERGSEVYHSEILELKNELLGIAEVENQYLASVRFTGRIKISDEIEELDETWILEKPNQGNGGWLLSGIQQNQQ